MLSPQDTLYKLISSEQDKIQLSFPKSEQKYTIKIFISKNKEYIMFKVEEINKISFSYFSEKFYFVDLNKKFKELISKEDITEAFNVLRNIIGRSKMKIEKKNNNNLNLTFFNYTNNDTDKLLFILRKRYISQDQINPMLIETINKDTKKIKNLEKATNNLNETLEGNIGIINNINNKIDNINNSIENIYKDLNQINNAFKNSIKEKDVDKFNKKTKKTIFKENKKNISFKNGLKRLFLLFLNIIYLIIIYNLLNHINSINDKLQKLSIKEKKAHSFLFVLENILGKDFLSDYYYSDPRILKEDIDYLRNIIYNNNISNASNEKNILENKSLNEFFNSEESVNYIKDLNIKTIIMEEKDNLISNSDIINYLKMQIIGIKNNTINSVNIKLKYSKENSKMDFYINLQNSKENLIYFKDENGSIIYIFCSNIIKLMENLMNKNVKKLKNSEIYIFIKSFGQNLSDKEIILKYIINIFLFIDGYNKSSTLDAVDLKIYDIIY